ncbi:hypothetical protein NFI96_022292 [Prochilodus magdalenae]|nr:hypothetical protein NFI96_022292 [Prochilodus magdalenae]
MERDIPCTVATSSQSNGSPPTHKGNPTGIYIPINPCAAAPSAGCLKIQHSSCSSAEFFQTSCVSGTFGEDWSVEYTQKEICALKGSTVFMLASYRHPSYLKGVGKFWALNPTKGGQLPDLTKDPGYSGRAQYLEGQKQTFSLRLERVTERDEHVYCLRITSDAEKLRYLGYPGVRLRVTGLRVEYPERVVEKNTTLLTCKTNCTLTSKTNVLWYRN